METETETETETGKMVNGEHEKGGSLEAQASRERR